ncbi:isochorismatase family protein, partial [Kitasatospora sp. NPDC059146]|uniref:isochorismatase family protein n=1 Tax=Kitasatospora sp. NPDC059146 TaxID=3346741 RepID=UPI0036951023
LRRAGRAAGTGGGGRRVGRAGGGGPGVVAPRPHHVDPGGHFSEHPDYRDSFPVHCVAGTEGGEFHPDFLPAVEAGAVDEVFYKGARSASKSGFEGFTADGTPLADWLHDCGVDAVDVVGIATDHCVKATALDARRAGFDARVLLDYTAGVAPDTTDAALTELRDAGVDLTGAPVVRS